MVGMRGQGFPLFFAVWVALGVAGGVFFYWNHDVALKRRLLPIYTTVVGAVFAGFLWYSTRDPRLLMVACPVIALITYLNIRNTFFCDACGRATVNSIWWTKAEYCAKCGASLRSPIRR
jgi:hypothetical protein